MPTNIRGELLLIRQSRVHVWALRFHFCDRPGWRATKGL